MNISENWKFARDPKNEGREHCWFKTIHPEAESAPVPGIIQQVFPAYHGVAWYWTSFRPDRSVGPGERYLLHFGAVDYLAEVWVNGRPVGGYEGGETPFDLDVTDIIRPCVENLLAVRVLNPINESIDGYQLAEIPHLSKKIPMRCGNAFNWGGIMAPVELRVVPALRVSDLFARPDWKTGRIAVTVTVQNDQAATKKSLSLMVAPAVEGGLLESIELVSRFPVGSSVHEMSFSIHRPRLWDLDDPFLYRVTATLGAHQHSVRCGFRDFCVKDGYFHLNGRRIFLKGTHTISHVPIGVRVAVIPDHVRRDLIHAKASGFNIVRFIGCLAFPEQLDFCDEIGLMVNEGCMAAWGLKDSPKMSERFDRNTSAMIRRDRNHPSLTIWELLNETNDGPVFRQAVNFLPLLRRLDPTRLVLLNSGRWDRMRAAPNSIPLTTGSVSNPDSVTWEPVWGNDGESNKPIAGNDEVFKMTGYVPGVEDVHIYPLTPHTPFTRKYISTLLGRDSKPSLLSEYGVGSMMNVIQEWRHFEQAGARPDLEDAEIVRIQSEALCADWKRLGFDDVYPFPEDLLRESQRLHARQRTLGFDLVRSNPKICGFNLTGMLDHGMTGEGLWTFWREWKPGTFDAVSDGWSPLRWCLFVDPMHGYTGREITIKAVLANENELKPGRYPATFRLMGPSGPAWQKKTMVNVDQSLAVPVLKQTVRIAGPAGPYIFAANLDCGGAPSGGRLTFYLSDEVAPLPKKANVTLWGIDREIKEWLTAHGLVCRQFETTAQRRRTLILVGCPRDNTERNAGPWKELAGRIAQGSTTIFLNPRVFKFANWLPLRNKGRYRVFEDSLYHKECVAKRHPVFDGLPGPGIMDWDYYGPVIPHEMFEGMDTPEETPAAAFATGYPGPTGYETGLLIAQFRFGQGRIILNTPYLLENLDCHPTADRLLLNLVRHGLTYARGPLAGVSTGCRKEIERLRCRPNRDAEGHKEESGKLGSQSNRYLSSSREWCITENPISIPITEVSLPETSILKWQTMIFDDDFVNIFAVQDFRGGLAYAEGEVEAPTAFSANLLLGPDGPCKVWMDGQFVGIAPVETNPAVLDSHSFPVTLSKGRHRITIAFDRRDGWAWGFFIRFEWKDADAKEQSDNAVASTRAEFMDRYPDPQRCLRNT